MSCLAAPTVAASGNATDAVEANAASKIRIGKNGFMVQGEILGAAIGNYKRLLESGKVLRIICVFIDIGNHHEPVSWL